MTLILTAMRKNGACVCADKRSTNDKGVSVDNLDKIYPIPGECIILFNHGINKFNGKNLVADFFVLSCSF